MCQTIFGGLIPNSLAKKSLPTWMLISYSEKMGHASSAATQPP